MSNLLLLRLDEELDALRPRDALGHLGDLAASGGLVAPPVDDAALGRGRSFLSASTRGYLAQDVTPGDTLATRDVSIQVVLSVDVALAAAYGSPGTIYARGVGTASAEYMGAGLELRVVNAAARIMEIRWIWHTTGGTLKTQVGGHFEPDAGRFLMLTATRRWVSSTEVVLRYYLGDQLLSEVTSVDGDIGGGTTGTTSIGARYTGAAWGNYLDGVLDELRVTDDELTAEEIAATWNRITVLQPQGYGLAREMHDPGFPMSADPASRVQRETKLWGHGLGFAAAQAENIRSNILPDRAYGTILERWEAITKQAPKPGDSVDTRRSRVVGRMRQRSGVSIPGIGEALTDLLDASASDLAVVGFTPTTRDEFTADLDAVRWQFDASGLWTAGGSGVSVASVAARPFNGSNQSWLTGRMAIGGNGRGAHILAKLGAVSGGNGAETGLWLGDMGLGNYILFGYRYVTGAPNHWYLVTEVFRGYVSQGVVIRATDITTAVVPRWLHLRTDPDDVDDFAVGWNATSELAAYTEVTGIASGISTGLQWAGLYVRTISGAVAVGATWTGVVVRAPFGDRALRGYVYRDPAIAGRPDPIGAENVLRGLKQAHTAMHAVTTLTALADTLGVADHVPLGAI